MDFLKIGRMWFEWFSLKLDLIFNWIFDNILFFDNGFCMVFIKNLIFLVFLFENKGDICMILGICKSWFVLKLWVVINKLIFLKW